MSFDNAPHIGKRILIPFLFDHYLFDYFQKLVPRLLSDGFLVTIISFVPQVKQKFSVLHPGLSVEDGPGPLRFLLNRSNRPLFRIGLWALGRLWSRGLRDRFDIAILPWDNKPLWYLIAHRLPSLSCHTVTDFYNSDTFLNYTALNGECTNLWSYKACTILDKLFEGKFLPRTMGRVMKFFPSQLVVDRMMGWRALSTLQGFGGIRYLTVTGTKIQENYKNCGLRDVEIFPVGSPNFEGLVPLKSLFTNEEKEDIRSRLGLKTSTRLFTFFLSPSRFSEIQIKEIITVVRIIREKCSNSQFLLKFHPKTASGEMAKFRNELNDLGEDVVLYAEYKGDEFNAKLVLSSYCLVQKQSTVGFIAMQFRIPIISYNLKETNYEDDMYEYLGGSFHVKNRGELESALERLDDHEAREDLRKSQMVSCDQFCSEVVSPCGEISKIIQCHFDGP